MHHTVILKGDFIRKEVTATGVVTPGMTVSRAGAAGGGTRKAFAVENDLIGRGIDDNYAVGEVIQYGVFEQGAEVYALLAAGDSVSDGDALKDNGSGVLTAIGTGEEALTVAYAAEDLSNSSSDPMRIVAEVA